MKRAFRRSWKTTGIGLMAAVAHVIVPLLQSGTVSLHVLMTAAGLAALGAMAKDADVSSPAWKIIRRKR